MKDQDQEDKNYNTVLCLTYFIRQTKNGDTKHKSKRNTPSVRQLHRVPNFGSLLQSIVVCFAGNKAKKMQYFIPNLWSLHVYSYIVIDDSVVPGTIRYLRATSFVADYLLIILITKKIVSVIVIRHKGQKYLTTLGLQS